MEVRWTIAFIRPTVALVKTVVVHVSDARPWEKEIDSAFNQAATVLNTTERHRLFDRYQQIIYDNNPLIMLFAGLDLCAVKTGLVTTIPLRLGTFWPPKNSLHNVEEVYFKQRR